MKISQDKFQPAPDFAINILCTLNCDEVSMKSTNTIHHRMHEQCMILNVTSEIPLFFPK